MPARPRPSRRCPKPFIPVRGSEDQGYHGAHAAMWPQSYDPLSNGLLSTLCAALPVLVLLGTLAILRLKAHTAALLGLATAFAVAVLIFGMPVRMALGTAAFGVAYGLFPIG